MSENKNNKTFFKNKIFKRNKQLNNFNNVNILYEYRIKNKLDLNEFSELLNAEFEKKNLTFRLNATLLEKWEHSILYPYERELDVIANYLGITKNELKEDLYYSFWK